MLTFLIFLIILSLLVFIHELGHYLAAKKTGVKVDEFGFGYPPKIWGKKIRGTLYSLNWLPFGGFVRLYGENYLEGKKKSEAANKALCFRPKKVRALVAVAGVVGNFLLGIVCFSIIYSAIGIPTPVDYVLIDAVLPGSPAQTAGLKAGQVVVSLQGQPIKNTQTFMELVKENEGQKVSLVVEEGKNGPQKEYLLVPRQNPPAGEGALGVAISSIEMVFYPAWQMPFRGAWVGLKEAIAWGLTIILGIGEAIKSLMIGIVPEVAGPVGIYQITAGVVQGGWLLTLRFIGILSINLAVLNLLPIPALDGSRLLFIGIEAVIRRRVKPKIEEYIHLTGMAFLIGLMLLVTFNDFSRLFKDNPFWQNIINSIMIEIKKLRY